MDTQLVRLPLWVVSRLLLLAKGEEQDHVDHSAVAFAETTIGPFTPSPLSPDFLLEEEITLRLRQAMFRSGWIEYGDRQAVLDGNRDDHFGPNHPACLALRELLSSPDARIASLIRYNSAEVVRRRTLAARLRNACTALQKAATTFRDYARLHRAKDTVDGSVKALRNDEMATICEEALAFDPDPTDYGRP